MKKNVDQMDSNQLKLKGEEVTNVSSEFGQANEKRQRLRSDREDNNLRQEGSRNEGGRQVNKQHDENKPPGSGEQQQADCEGRSLVSRRQPSEEHVDKQADQNVKLSVTVDNDHTFMNLELPILTLEQSKVLSNCIMQGVDGFFDKLFEPESNIRIVHLDSEGFERMKDEHGRNQ